MYTYMYMYSLQYYMYIIDRIFTVVGKICVTPVFITAHTHTQFQSAVSKLGSSFMLLCPSAAPLRHFLHREAQNCELQLDPFFYQYVDIYTEFSRGFPDNKRPDTLEEMCSCILYVYCDLSPSSLFGASIR